MTLHVHGFQLTDWQRGAVDAWLSGVDGMRGRGTIEVVTGGGKTLIALTCAARASELEPDLKVAIVVPTQALARQWLDKVLAHTDIEPDQVGMLGAGRRDTFSDKTMLIAVLNSAAEKLPHLASVAQPLMLIIDEAHRAGAPKLSRVLSTRAKYRLGLSATPDREEIGEDGEPLAYDAQIVGRKLGKVVYQFGLKQAREAGWLPSFDLSHHAVTLRPDERSRYEAISRQVDDARSDLRGLGGETIRARQLARQRDDLGEAARRWVTMTGQRKDLLYHAAERNRIAAEIVRQAFEGGALPRVILFHERVDESEELRAELAASLPGVQVALEHSKLAERSRRRALDDFASGAAPVLVSVKSLIEGIDVPAADTGISVASTASARQRVQSLGRVLRRASDGAHKHASMHLIYVDDSVDDLIYGKADWSDLTGESANAYWRWPLDALAPEPLPGPPRRPLPTEEAAWEQVRSSRLPVAWPGEVTGQEYSVDTHGVVHNAFNRLIINPQGVDQMVFSFRGHGGGRFRVTPQHRLVLLWERGAEGENPTPWIVGQLQEPFEVVDEIDEDNALVPLDASVLVAGQPYAGPSDKKGGTYRLSQKAGGQVERNVRGGRLIASADGVDAKAQNARAVLAAWESLNRPTSKFFVNSIGHAWYEGAAGRHFLAVVGEGFNWPDQEEEKE